MFLVLRILIVIQHSFSFSLFIYTLVGYEIYGLDFGDNINLS